MLSKSSKREVGFIYYIAKFAISRFVILRFELNLIYCVYKNAYSVTQLRKSYFLNTKGNMVSINMFFLLLTSYTNMEVILFDSIFLSQTKSFKKTLGYQFVMIYNEYNNLLLVVLIYMILHYCSCTYNIMLVND